MCEERDARFAGTVGEDRPVQIGRSQGIGELC